MKVLVTGADGFIGKNLRTALSERPGTEVLPVTRKTDDHSLREMISNADAVVHLAGINRPQDPSEFQSGNADFTNHLCQLLIHAKKPLPIAFSSSIQALLDNAYGKSKRDAEDAIKKYSETTNAPAAIFRFPNVFGKWSRPNYNSAVATFCHETARGNPIQINDPSVVIRLLYVDDAVASLIGFLESKPSSFCYIDATPEYSIAVGELADKIRGFHADRDQLKIDRVGSGLIRALYSTYVSFLPQGSFGYAIPKHGDQRGEFVEMLKSKDSGQFSYFTALPGVTRGGHYHHTKTEKFLVIKGKALFQFRNIVTNEKHALESNGTQPFVVETVPGWAHDVTNIGQDELIVMLWANEVFDRARPDTIPCKVSN